jgi:hypothetical protein
VLKAKPSTAESINTPCKMIGGAEEIGGAAIESVTSEPEPPQPFRTKMETRELK